MRKCGEGMDKLKFVSKWMTKILKYQVTIQLQRAKIAELEADIKRFEREDLKYWEYQINFGGTNDGRKRKSDGR